MAAPGSLRVSRIIRADSETLFRAWTDPQVLMHWWRQEGEGWAFAGAYIDLRVGGRYRLAMTHPEGKTHAAGRVLPEGERAGRPGFPWDWGEPGGSVGGTPGTR